MTTSSISPHTFTIDEQRNHVIAYTSTPHGSRTSYLDAHDITNNQIRRWLAAMADSNLETELVPRHTKPALQSWKTPEVIQYDCLPTMNPALNLFLPYVE